MEIIGHQGTQDSVHGNTMAAFALAAAGQAHVIETDVQITKDGEVVIFHDLALHGLPIKELTLKQLKAKQDIPTLSELLTFLQGNHIKLNLEIKRDPLHPEHSYSTAEYVHRILSLVQQHGLVERVYFSSFDPETLFTLRKSAPHASISFLYNQETLDVLEQFTHKPGHSVVLELAHSFGANILSPDYLLLRKPHLLQQLQASNLLIHPWTVNEIKDWDYCLDLKVDGIITDYPEKLRKYLHASDYL